MLKFTNEERFSIEISILSNDDEMVLKSRGTRNVVNDPGPEFFFKVKKLTPPPPA